MIQKPISKGTSGDIVSEIENGELMPGPIKKCGVDLNLGPAIQLWKMSLIRTCVLTTKSTR